MSQNESEHGDMERMLIERARTFLRDPAVSLCAQEVVRSVLSVMHMRDTEDGPRWVISNEVHMGSLLGNLAHIGRESRTEIARVIGGYLPLDLLLERTYAIMDKSETTQFELDAISARHPEMEKPSRVFRMPSGAHPVSGRWKAPEK